MKWVQDPIFRRYLLRPLTMFMIVLGAIAFLHLSLGFLHDEFRDQAAVQERGLKNLKQQIRFLRYQEQLFANYGDKYYQLINQGLANTQDRVKWTDALLQLKQQMAIAPFAFQFEPQELIQKDHLQALKINQPIFYVTKLNLRMGLHSDLDLLKLLEVFSRKITPLFLVNECQIRSSVERMKKLEFDPKYGLIEAKCVLTLFESKPRLFKGAK